MIRVSIFYPNTADSQFDLEYYLTKHIPFLEEKLKPEGLDRVEVDQAIGTPMPDVPAPYMIIAHLVFDNFENMQTAMGAHSRELMADVPNFTNVQPVVQINRMM